MGRKLINVIDTELSCWEDREFQRTQLMEIFEFGIAQIDVETLTVVRSGSYYVKNERHEVTRFCTQLTGVTQRKLDRQGAPLAQVGQWLCEKWGTKNRMHPIIAWGDERRWMEADCVAKGVPYMFHNGLINLADYYRFGFLSDKRKSCGLKKACARYGVEVVQPQHTAEADAITTANLVIAMIKAGHIWPEFA